MEKLGPCHRADCREYGCGGYGYDNCPTLESRHPKATNNVERNEIIMEDTSGRIYGNANQRFKQDQKVMVRRLGDGKQYRATICGIAMDVGLGAKLMICEMYDNCDYVHNFEFTHVSIPEVCIDPYDWEMIVS
jgi:hypothetical protein